MNVTVVLPTYNEAENLPRMVQELLSLPVEGLSILVVDDDSPDGTGHLAEELARRFPGRVRVIHRKGKLGLGTAYVQGFQAALAGGADYVVQMDCDFSHDPAIIPQFIALMRDYDVVIGSRYAPGGRVDARWSKWRKVLSKAANIYARLIAGIRVRDATGGFKCFRRRALEGLDLQRIRSDGYAFQVEMNYICQQRGYRIAEVPITFADRLCGQSKMSMRIIREAMWRVWQIKWRY